ncbi:MAG: HDIG domain-containing protein [Deltaproteobacteria bacterium]|nr:HDIG domain-containing protein [Deltaproteobacteria bacterium]
MGRSPRGLLSHLRSELACQMTWRDFGCGLVVAGILALLLVQLEYTGIRRYAAGDIAREDVKASTDFTVEDPAATQVKAREAAEDVPWVFDYDPSLSAGVERQIRDLFGQGRALVLETKRSSGRRLSPSQRTKLAVQLREQLSYPVPEPALQVFIVHEFAHELEEQLLHLMRRAYEAGILSSRDLLAQARPRVVLLRNLASGEEKRVEEVSAIKEVSQVRAAVRDQLYDSGIPPSDRRSLQLYLEQILIPNITFNRAETRAREQAAARNIDPVVIQVKKRKVIVREGDEITPRILIQLKALREHERPRNTGVQFMGFFLLAAIFLHFLWRYLVLYPSRQASTRSRFLLVSLILVLNLAVVRFFLLLIGIVAGGSTHPFLQVPEHLYPAVPFAFGAILATLLTTVHVALLFSLILSLLAGVLTGQISLAVYSLVGSFAALYGIHHYKERSTMVKAGLLVGSLNVVIMVTMELLSLQPSPASFLAWKMVPAFSGGIIAVMIASLLLPLLESLFHLTTDIRLLELSNLDAPILRRLAVEAPGTYHHSIVVGTLAESAAKAIGANPILARVGAYYHDIVKMLKPEYYVENQIYVSNKHEQLSPGLSRLVILNHVKGGLQMAREIGLPPRVSDMISQHHGTRSMTYFYQKARELASDGEVNETDFRYPGPKPQTREAAILMLADGVEAASRSLIKPTPAQLEGVVHKITTAVMSDGQLDECDITLLDLDLIRKSFFKVLMGIFHHRVGYPGYDFTKAEKADQVSPIH